ncbi:matrixin family metalloprotease [Acinetobacter sp. NBRC 100985]|uniref:matrixin family metalloprotease n=1 Tax=Acinetobacter TaxID=469 RepID=UPI00054FA9A3|nr:MULTISPECIES: matrixin family metalloprotease [Acinetobacter]
MYPFIFMLATCFLMLLSPSALAKVSSSSTSPQIRYSTENPLRYRIEELDPRLNLNKQQVIELSQQAAAIWSKDTGQNYFVYDPSATFVINLVFDQRQIRSIKRAENLHQLEKQQQIWLDQNQQLQILKQQLRYADTQLELQKTEYQAQAKSYQTAIEQLNAAHSKKTLAKKFQKQQHALESQSQLLQARIYDYNLKVQQLQKQSEKSNQLRQQLVQSVDEFNQTFKPQVLHKGQFDGKQIFIYEFSSLDDLRLTLAHEFGHALGLKHTQDPKSLMYPRIKEQDAKDFQLTNTDLKLLGFAD